MSCFYFVLKENLNTTVVLNLAAVSKKYAVQGAVLSGWEDTIDFILLTGIVHEALSAHGPRPAPLFILYTSPCWLTLLPPILNLGAKIE